MKTGRNLQDLAAEIERQQNAKRDLLVDTPAISVAPDREANAMQLTINSDNAVEVYGIKDIAHRQIGSHLGIPAPYYDKMRNDFPALLAYNVNGWLGKTPSKRMVRTLDGNVRAFLSDKYRRIDNFEVAETVLPVLADLPGVQVQSCEITESRMYIKVVNPRIETEVDKGDVVQAGLVISNSEVGHGSLSVSPLVYRLVCTNGMIAADATVRKYHVGRLNNAADDFSIYRDETIEADDRAMLMKIEDTVKAAMDEAKFAAIVTRMREAKDAKMDAVAVPQVVELAQKSFGFTQDEGRGILGHLIEGGELSLFGLANAVTRHSQDVDSYDRATELEAAGWKVLTMAPAQWSNLQKAATNA